MFNLKQNVSFEQPLWLFHRCGKKPLVRARPKREASTFLQEMNEMLPWSDDKATFPAQVYEMELNQNSLPDNKVDV